MLHHGASPRLCCLARRPPDSVGINLDVFGGSRSGCQGNRLEKSWAQGPGEGGIGTGKEEHIKGKFRGLVLPLKPLPLTG